MEMNEFKSLLRDYDIPLIYFILKKCTNKENAFSCADISKQLNLLVSSNDDSIEEYYDRENNLFSSRTIDRKLGSITKLTSALDESSKLYETILASLFGGRIRVREADGIYYGKNLTGKGIQKKYYFEPLLEESDMNLIMGSIQSSRYLSNDEKRFLLSRVEIILPSVNRTEYNMMPLSQSPIMNVNSPVKRPKRKTVGDIPGNDSALLKNTFIIYEAIERKAQIEVLYGIYDIDKATGKITFHARNKNNQYYILNPYALLWNDGKYYLLATHEDHETPTHFRVDRIIDVRLHTVTNADGSKSYSPRNKIPSVLAPFYKSTADKRQVFDSVKYANTYPGMVIYKDNNIIDCTFECTSWSLQMLVDNFGADITVQKSIRDHDPSEVDYNGQPQEFLMPTIRGVQYDNIKRYAVNNSQYLTVIFPHNLAEDVKETLIRAVAKYEQ